MVSRCLTNGELAAATAERSTDDRHKRGRRRTPRAVRASGGELCKCTIIGKRTHFKKLFDITGSSRSVPPGPCWFDCGNHCFDLAVI
mmetsp:Transcript_44784/g.136686  ORF Transcript_44784/g.136686 Transcript_44784/m.136686 type:complete len:87 (-) Transcript_44784:86-346(-)